MFTMILAVTGVLTGLGGLALGGYALARARDIDADTRVLAQRAAASAQVGAADPLAVRDMAVLHYDALEEMSGARSFSLALLNGDGDGVVLTSINGRTESRTYAKAVVRGESGTLLSPEEYRVVRAARLGEGIGTTVRAPRVSGPVVAGDAEVPVTVVPDPQAPPAGPGPRPEREEPAGPSGTVWVPEIGPEEPEEPGEAVLAADSVAAGTRLRTPPRTAPAPRGGAE